MAIKSVDNVGVTFVNEVLGAGTFDGTVNIQFGTYLFSPTEKDIDPDLALSCRLRMSVTCAQGLRDQIDRVLERHAEILAAAQVEEVPGETPTKKETKTKALN